MDTISIRLESAEVNRPDSEAEIVRELSVVFPTAQVKFEGYVDRNMPGVVKIAEVFQALADKAKAEFEASRPRISVCATVRNWDFHDGHGGSIAD